MSAETRNGDAASCSSSLPRWVRDAIRPQGLPSSWDSVSLPSLPAGYPNTGFQTAAASLLDDLAEWRGAQCKKMDDVVEGLWSRSSEAKRDLMTSFALLTNEAYFRALLEFRARLSTAEPELKRRGRTFGEGVLRHLSGYVGLPLGPGLQGRASGSAPVAASVQEGEHSSTLCVLGRAADGTQHRGGFKAPSVAESADTGRSNGATASTLQVRLDEAGRAYMELNGTKIYGLPSSWDRVGSSTVAYEQLQPWIQPVLDPFVGGLLEPIGEAVDVIKWRAALAAGAICVGSLTAGFVLGYLARGGGGRATGSKR